MVEAAVFFLPATLVPPTLYFLWIWFGQESVLPLDLKKSIAAGRVIGDGKGLWGLPAAVVVGLLCAAFQSRGEEAVIMAVGADFGCVANSFIKRRLGHRRGVDFKPWDHLDFFLGGSLFYHLQFGLSWPLFATGLCLCGTAHYLGRTLLRHLLAPWEPKT